MNINSPALFLKMDVIVEGYSYDSSGNLQNFTNSEAVVLPDNTFGSCTSFDNGACLLLDNSTIGTALANGSTACSITTWLAAEELSATANPVGMYNVFFSCADPAGDNNNCVLGITPAGALQVMISSNGTNVIQVFGTTELSVAGWHFIAVSMNGSALTVQIDSISSTITTSAAALTANITDCVTIACSYDEDSCFSGIMANLRVYAAALASTDIVSVMNADLSNELMVYLPLSESTATTTPDLSPYEFPATPVGNPVITPEVQFGAAMQFDGATQYISLGGPQYVKTMMLTEVTVQAWINTSATTNMVIASYDAANYWELDVIQGTESGTLVVSWVTVDQNSVPDTLNGLVVVNDKKWHFISVTYHAGDGAKCIYVDGVLDNSSVTTAGLPLGNQNAPSIYGYVGIGSTDSTVGTTGFFNGELCQFWLYHQALTLDVIQQNMQAGLIASSSYLLDYPIAFSLQQEGQGNTLFIYDAIDGQTLLAQLSNTSTQAIVFPACSATAPTLQDFQLAIIFRPGTISQDSIAAPITLSENASWNMATSQVGGLFTLLFNSVNGYTFYPMTQLTLTLNNAGADPSGGARTTRVQLSYNGLTYSQGGGAVEGTTEQVVGIVNHAGQQNTPLFAAFTYTDTVFNGANNSNALSISITNMMSASEGTPMGVVFNGSNTTSPTVITLYFDGSDDTIDNDPGALNIYSVIKEIIPVMDGTNNGGATWAINKETDGVVPYWTIIPTTTFTLDAGDVLQIDLSIIVAAGPAGICNAYVGYQNLPGYWDGEFILEIKKSNVYSDGTNLGIGTGTPSYPISINNSGTGIDSPLGVGMNFYVNGVTVPCLQLDASGNLFTGSSAIANNMTLNNGDLTLTLGDLTLTSGNLNMTAGTLTITSGSLVLSDGDMGVAGNIAFYPNSSDGTSGLYFEYPLGTEQAAIVTDTSGNLNFIMTPAAATPVTAMQISPAGSIGMGISPGPGTALSIFNDTAQNLSSSASGLNIGNDTNYLSFDFQSIYSRYLTGGLSSLGLTGTIITLNGTETDATGIVLQSNSVTQMSIGVGEVNIQPNDAVQMSFSSSGITIPTGTVINNLPVVTWQTQSFSFNNSKGKLINQTQTLTFGSTVISAIAMIKSWSLNYTSGDHHLQFENIAVSCAQPSGPSYTQVQVTVIAQLSDDKSDDSWNGTATAVVLALVSQVPLTAPKTQ